MADSRQPTADSRQPTAHSGAVFLSPLVCSLKSARQATMDMQASERMESAASQPPAGEIGFWLSVSSFLLVLIRSLSSSWNFIFILVNFVGSSWSLFTLHQAESPKRNQPAAASPEEAAAL